MNNFVKSSSSTFSSSPTPPLGTTAALPPTTGHQQQRLSSASRNEHQQRPSIISINYDYPTMSPSTYMQMRRESSAFQNATRQTPPQLDMDIDQYGSLFGDPVQPPPPPASTSELFDTSQVFRANYVELSSEDETTTGFGRTITLAPACENNPRLFSDIPYSSSLVRRDAEGRNFDVLSTTTTTNTNATMALLPRLEPPDIQILPNSSASSSSDNRYTPTNYALLTPSMDVVRSRPTLTGLYEIAENAQDINEVLETMTITDVTGTSKYSEATQRVTQFAEDFKNNVGSLGTNAVGSATSKRRISRQFSNESYSSSEWFRPASNEFPEFSKIPRLRPSSKNVMQIKRDEMPMHHSPVATMIHDSNESSSGEEQRQRLDTTQVLATVPLDSLTPPERPPNPSPNTLRDLQVNLLYYREKYPVEPQEAPPPVPPAPEERQRDDFEYTQNMKRETSPAIITDSIATGGEYRVATPRLHKKSSFSIISPKSPQTSRGPSPSPRRLMQTAAATSASPKKTLPSPRHKMPRKSLSSTQLKLPHLTAYSSMMYANDESPRPSVQFNMTGRRSPSKMPAKGILQHRESLTSSQDTIPPKASPRHQPFRSDMLMSSYSDRVKSCETLPLITDPYRTAIPRLNRSNLDVRRESSAIPPGALARPIKPNPNPTRQQKGLLRIINNGDITSRIPISNWASMDDLLAVEQHKRARRTSLSPLNLHKNRRRSSSTSPERRSSTVTASDRRSSNLSTVTTSDFSFRRPSIVLPPTQQQQQRRKSMVAPKSPAAKRKQSSVAIVTRAPRNKIAKPTTLSPIIGTPNKDSSTPQSPSRGGGSSVSDSGSRRTSISKIPVRNASSHSRPSSRIHSRSNSPLKEFSAELLTDLSERIEQKRSHSRPTSRADSHPVSRINSRQPSRSTSRASTRPISRGPSRASSRPNSRMEQAREIANSRSNSRLSMRGQEVPSKPSRDVSPQVGRKQRPTAKPIDRRKSVSLSPASGRKSTSLERRRSMSPVSRKRVGVRPSRATQPKPKRTESLSRIPRRSASNSKAPRTKSSAKQVESSRSPRVVRKPSPPMKPAIPTKQLASAKKAPTPMQKQKPQAAADRRTPASSVGKPSATATKNQPTSNTQKPATSLRKISPTKASSIAALSGKSKKKDNTAAGKKPAGDSKTKTQSPATGKVVNPKETPAKASTTSKGNESATEKAEMTGTPVKSTETPSKTATPSHSMKTPSTPTTMGTPASGGGGGGGMRRSPSAMSLKRMGSTLSLLSRKRGEGTLKAPLTETVDEATADADDANTAQPVQLTPAVTGQLVGGDPEMAAHLPSAILEKSQKTLENVQKTVTVATDEIHKTINENLTDLKSLETGMAEYMGDSITSPTSSVTTVVENRKSTGPKAMGQSDSVSRVGTADNLDPSKGVGVGVLQTTQKSPVPPGQPIEAAVSVVNAEHRADTLTASTLEGGGGGDTTDRNFEFGVDEKTTATGASASGNADTSHGSGDDSKRRSPDGQGGSAVDSGDNNGSREFLKEKDDDDDALSSPGGCCRCCTRFCLPCRRSRCTRCLCCRRKPTKIHDDTVEPVLSATSSATTTNLEIIDEKQRNAKDSKTKSPGCWQKLNCCARCRKPKTNKDQGKASPKRHKDMPAPNISTTSPTGQGKCGLCLSKVFCCRSVNRVDVITGDETEVKKCCFCIPCRRKKSARPQTDAAWHDPESGIAATDASVLEGAAVSAPPMAMQKDGCCKRFCAAFLCCKKKPMPKPSDSRRASMKAPPPPAEDTRRKLHVDLVEYTSKMKAAIPVLPLYLAWFCVICNTVVPGLGTLLSGFFCVCIGIPRFSQYDSAKARFGSLIINIIVAIAQLFCVLFCFVGWGWSIWWGTIMLKCARKLSKIKKVERLEMEEEKRQAQAAAEAARVAANAEHEMTKS